MGARESRKKKTGKERQKIDNRDWMTERRRSCHLKDIKCEVEKKGERGNKERGVRKKEKGEYKDKKKRMLESESYEKLIAREEEKSKERKKGSKGK